MPWIKRDVPLTGNIMGEAALESSDFDESIEITDPDYVAWILGKAITKKLAALTAQREDIIDTGVQYTVATVAHLFQVDTTSMILINNAIAVKERGNSTFFPLNWIDMNNDTVNLTHADLVGIHGLAGLLYQESYDHYQTLRISIKAAVDQAALDAIDITIGWPTVPYTGV